MEENSQEESQVLKLTNKEIYTKIWFSPRLVFKYINDNVIDEYVIPLMILAGITSGFDRASNSNMGDNLSLPGVIASCIILGGLLGWISYYIYAALLSWTGKWLNGQGDTNSILRMLSYAMIPSIAALVLLIPQILILGNEIFQSEIDIFSKGIATVLIFYITVTLEIFLGCWSIILTVVGISEVQKLSIGKSILNLILPAIIIIIPIVCIAFLLGDFFG